MLVDIDRFKTVNDGHGHAAGDAVLRAVAARLADGLREEDLAARWGGEEFLLLPDAADAAVVCERLRAAIADTPVRVDDAVAIARHRQLRLGRLGWRRDRPRRWSPAPTPRCTRPRTAGRDRVVAAADALVG